MRLRPGALLNKEKAAVDLVVIVLDNESWVDAKRNGPTAMMQEWTKLVKRCPQARLVCIDIAPYGTTQAIGQAAGRPEILNVGGFSDAMFECLARFVSGETCDWVSIVEQVEV